MWLAKGEAALRQGGAATENEAAYVHFVHLIEGGKAKRRTLLKLQMRRAAQGTDKRPGDWRAAHALGAITDSEEFVIEQRIKFSMEREEALDRLEAAFDGAPEQLTRDQACELALLAIAGRVRLEPLAQADGSTSSSGGRTDPGSGEAVHAAPAAPEAAGVPRT